MNILEKIIAVKKREIEKLRQQTSLEDLRHKAAEAPPPQAFLDAIKAGGTSLITELKKASPSRGVMRVDFDPTAIARVYHDGGARALSVLTDVPFFQGKLEYLAAVREAVPLPLLRKDFILDEIQIWESRAAGADAVLLIARLLTAEKLRNLAALALEAGCEPLVEVHSEIDLAKALATKARLIGVNNRNLDTFETDIKVSLRLKQLIPEGRTAISESGIATREDIETLEKAGFQGFLVGEALVTARNIKSRMTYLLTGELDKENPPTVEDQNQAKEEPSERTGQLRQVRDEVWNLKQSTLYAYRRKNKYYPVLGAGSHRAQVVFIGEAPGENEAKTGRPFCGAAGRVLEELLESIGLPRSEVYITNILKDRPPDNRDPHLEEIALYSPFLLRQIGIIKPKVLATLGRFSMQFIMERFGLEEKIKPISRIHGQVFQGRADYGPVFVIPFYHPAAALYRAPLKEDLKQDFQNLKSLLED